MSRDEGGSREHALKWRPSFTPSFARLPSFKNAAPRRTGSKTTPAPASTKHAYNSTFGGGASAGQGNDKYAGKIPPLFFSLSLSLSLFTFIHASFFYSSRREIKNRGKERALTYRRTFSRILTRCKLEKRPPKHRTRRTTNYSRDLVYKSCVWPIFGVFSFCWLL